MRTNPKSTIGPQKTLLFIAGNDITMQIIGILIIR